ncbi:hypothetical protein N431DRAFT_445480 [Stipitochalara longipes BDJ]|nr:hypothetical protein N431DRAFT_445480 [Stipitochalara longipes BDJ]
MAPRMPCVTEHDGAIFCPSAATSNSPAPAGALTTSSPSMISAELAQFSSLDKSFFGPAATSNSPAPTKVLLTAALPTTFSVASGELSRLYGGSASAIKTVMVTVTHHHHHHHNGTYTQSHPHHSSFSSFASDRGQHNGTRTFSRHSRPSSFPGFTTLSGVSILTASGGFAADQASNTPSLSKASPVSTTKAMSAFTTGGGYYD